MTEEGLVAAEAGPQMILMGGRGTLRFMFAVPAPRLEIVDLVPTYPMPAYLVSVTGCRIGGRALHEGFGTNAEALTARLRAERPWLLFGESVEIDLSYLGGDSVYVGGRLLARPAI